MKLCWNCHRSIELAASTCVHCQASVPGTSTADPASFARVPPPAAPPAPPQVRSRATFVLADPTQAAPPPDPTGATGEEQERSLRRAIAENRRASLALCGVLLALVTAWWYSGGTEVLETVNCWSISEAKRRGLLDRTLVATPAEFEWGGRKVTIEGAWVGQLAEVRYASPFDHTRVYLPTGRRRVYFKTRYVTWPETPQFWHGNPPTPCGLVRPDARIKRFILHYIDVVSSDPGPQTLVARDSARPGAATVKLVLN